MPPRHALVTGGTRGIGAAIALKLLSDGLSVTVTGRTSSSLPPSGCELAAVDFSNPAELRGFTQRLGREAFDVVINNAGVNAIGPFASYAVEDFDRLHQVNLRAAFLICQAVLPYMVSKGWGRIVNVSSVFGVVSKEFRAAYSATKFGLDGMTAALAAETAQHGILANCVSPGIIDTELTRRILGEEGIARLIESVPIRRLGRPDEVAELVAWLASPRNTYISGQNIVIDGGFTRV